MKTEPVKNPNVPKNLTPEQYDLIGRHIQEYWKAINVGHYGKQHSCYFCKAFTFKDGRQSNCLICPLGDGQIRISPCAYHKLFVPCSMRPGLSTKKLQARMDYLIAQLDINGIEIYDEEI